jgi:hypothetical protein
MPAGLPVAFILLTQAASASPTATSPATTGAAPPTVYGPAAPAQTKSTVTVTAAQRTCAPEVSDPNSREIIVCAPRPQGYRIDPDLLRARKEHRDALAGRPHNPHESFRDNGCSVVGPAGCVFQPGINLLAAAATLAKMADRLSKGEEIGSLFVTDPQTSEYQLYLDAKKEREAKEAAAKAKARPPAASAPVSQPTNAAPAQPAPAQQATPPR